MTGVLKETLHLRYGEKVIPETMLWFFTQQVYVSRSGFLPRPAEEEGSWSKPTRYVPGQFTGGWVPGFNDRYFEAAPLLEVFWSDSYNSDEWRNMHKVAGRESVDMSKSPPRFHQLQAPTRREPRKALKKPVLRTNTKAVTKRPFKYPKSHILSAERIMLYKKRWDKLEDRRIARYLAKAHRSFTVAMTEYERQVVLRKARIARDEAKFALATKKWNRRQAIRKIVAARHKKLHYKRGDKGAVLFDNPFRLMNLKRDEKSPAWFMNQIAYPFRNFVRADPETNEGFQEWTDENAVLQTWISNTPLDTPGLTHDSFRVLHTKVFRSIETSVEAHDRRLVTKLYDKIKNQKVHVGNLLAERRQTYDLIHETLARLTKLIQLRKGLVREMLGFLKSPKRMANDVLAFQFGAKPLVDDLYGLGEVLSTIPKTEGAEVIARTNLGRSGVLLDHVSSYFRFSGKLKVSYVVKFTVDNSTGHALSSLGLVNPAEILWEVTPWSFVADWLVPIGAWISSLTALVGLTFITGTRHVTLTGRFDFGPQPGAARSGAGDTPLGVMPIGVFFGTMTNREVLFAPPSNHKILGIKNPISLSHAIDSIALLIQKLPTRVKKVSLKKR